MRSRTVRSGETPADDERPAPRAGAFVVQHHRCDRGGHFDWMFEAAAGLITFQVPCPPNGLRPGSPATVRRLPDHRRVYLTYEGLVSGNRGEVRIHDRGDYEAAGSLRDRWEVRLRGQCMEGRFLFSLIGDDSYRLVRLDKDGLGPAQPRSHPCR